MNSGVMQNMPKRDDVKESDFVTQVLDEFLENLKKDKRIDKDLLTRLKGLVKKGQLADADAVMNAIKSGGPPK